jgi:hypothetical protein
MTRALEILLRLVALGVVLSSATLAALLLVVFAHDQLGMTPETIRTDALGVAGFLFAAVVAAAVLRRR